MFQLVRKFVQQRSITANHLQALRMRLNKTISSRDNSSLKAHESFLLTG
jgi:hypothetical protein